MTGWIRSIEDPRSSAGVFLGFEQLRAWLRPPRLLGHAHAPVVLPGGRTVLRLAISGWGVARLGRQWLQFRRGLSVSLVVPVDAPLTLTLFNALGLSRHTLAVPSTTGLAPAAAPVVRAHLEPPSPRVPSPPEPRLPVLASERLAPAIDLSKLTPKE